MSRSLITLTTLSALALACRPPASTYDAGCYPAPISEATDAGVPQCQAWAAGCDVNGVTALGSQITDLFTSNGACTQDSDCALYGKPISYLCYERSFTPPINASKRPQMDVALANLLCGFCEACFADGGILQGDVLPSQTDAGCTEVSCSFSPLPDGGLPSTGQCVAFNPSGS